MCGYEGLLYCSKEMLVPSLEIKVPKAKIMSMRRGVGSKVASKDPCLSPAASFFRVASGMTWL